MAISLVLQLPFYYELAIAELMMRIIIIKAKAGLKNVIVKWKLRVRCLVMKCEVREKIRQHTGKGFRVSG